jgi:hypothetical protein
MKLIWTACDPASEQMWIVPIKKATDIVECAVALAAIVAKTR